MGNKYIAPPEIDSLIDTSQKVKVEDFKSEFYTEEIDFDKLAKDLKAGLPFSSFKFDYTKYISNETRKVFFSDPEGQTIESKETVTKPFTYKSADQSIQSAYFKGSKLNMYKGNLSGELLLSVFEENNNIQYQLSAPYAHTKEIESIYKSSIDTINDYEKIERFRAITLKTTSYADLFTFITYVKGIKELKYYKQIVNDKFNILFSKAEGNPKQIKKIYESAPVEVIQQRDDTKKLNDFLLLLSYSDTTWFKGDWFKNADNAMLKLLQGFKDITIIYDFFWINNNKLISLYKELSLDNKATFARIMQSITFAYDWVQKKDTKNKVSFPIDNLYIGGDYKIKSLKNSGITYKNATKDEVEKVMQSEENNLFYFNNYKAAPVVSDGYMDESDTRTIGLHHVGYHPLVMLSIVDTETNTRYNQIALMVKYTADAEHWAQIMDDVMLTATLVGMLFSGGSLLAGEAGILALMAYTDMAIGTTSLVLRDPKMAAAIRKLPGGDWFVDNWNEISAVAGGLMFSVAVVKGILTYGPSLIKAAVAAKTAGVDLIMEAWVRAINYLEIPNFIPGSLKLLPNEADVMKASGYFFKFTELRKLYTANAILSEGMMELGGLQKLGFVLTYKGEVLCSGTREEVKLVIHKLTAYGVDTAKLLDEWIDVGLLSKQIAFKQYLFEFLNGSVKQVFAKILTEYEEAALKFYTTKTGYKNFNKALRGEIEMTEEFLAQERMMNKALDKLPISAYNKADNLLYRIENLTDAQIAEYYQVGKTITNKHFTSASYDYNAIREAILTRPFTVIIRIKGKNGRLIERLSTLKSEKEILFKSETQFYIEKIGMTQDPLDWMNLVKEIILIEK